MTSQTHSPAGPVPSQIFATSRATLLAHLARPLPILPGARAADVLVMATYLHGIFAAVTFRHAVLGRLGLGEFEGIAYETMIEEKMEELAANREEHLDQDARLAAAAPVKAAKLSATG